LAFEAKKIEAFEKLDVRDKELKVFENNLKVRDFDLQVL
jgi:hypothetical protein